MTYKPPQRSRMPGAVLAVADLNPALQAYLEGLERGTVDHIQPTDQPDAFLSRERYRYAPLVLGPGVWNVTEYLAIGADDVHIIGSGYHTVITGSIRPLIGITGARVTLQNMRLVYSGAATTGFMLGVVASNVTLRNVWLEGNDAAQVGGVSLVSSDEFVVEGCRGRLLGGRSTTPMIWCDNCDRGLLLGNTMSQFLGAAYMVNVSNLVAACNDLSITANVTDPTYYIRHNTAGNHVLAGNIATPLAY